MSSCKVSHRILITHGRGKVRVNPSSSASDYAYDSSEE